MADPQEFNSLDELFRKTFDSLPDTPSPSGWDTPSPRIWEHVQTQLKPPRTGWSTQSILLVCGLAIAVMLGLYWAISKPDTPETPATATEIPVATTPEASETTTATTVETETRSNREPVSAKPERSAKPKDLPSKSGAPNRTPPQNTPATHTASNPADDAGHRRAPVSAPLPGTKRALPNTTERRQADEWLKAPWARPLAPLPNFLEGQTIRPVPAELKALVRPNGEQ